jgi:hypothetical protein
MTTDDDRLVTYTRAGALVRRPWRYTCGDPAEPNAPEPEALVPVDAEPKARSRTRRPGHEIVHSGIPCRCASRSSLSAPSATTQLAR